MKKANVRECRFALEGVRRLPASDDHPLSAAPPGPSAAAFAGVADEPQPLDCAPPGSSAAACVGVADEEEDDVLPVRSQHIKTYALMRVCLTWPYCLSYRFSSLFLHI